jgi:ATP-dependent DNA ligase
LKQAQKWFDKVGGDLDGIIAKRLDCPYAAGERTAAVKIKQIRTVDCVVGRIPLREWRADHRFAAPRALRRGRPPASRRLSLRLSKKKRRFP